MKQEKAYAKKKNNGITIDLSLCNFAETVLPIGWLDSKNWNL